MRHLLTVSRNKVETQAIVADLVTVGIRTKLVELEWGPYIRTA